MITKIIILFLPPPSKALSKYIGRHYEIMAYCGRSLSEFPPSNPGSVIW
jgi:hypothetical protein